MISGISGYHQPPASRADLFDPLHGVIEHLFHVRRIIRHTRQRNRRRLPHVKVIHFGADTLNSFCRRASSGFDRARFLKDSFPSNAVR